MDEPPDEEEAEADVADEDVVLEDADGPDDVAAPSFFAPPSAEEDAAGFEELVDDDRESVL